MPGLTQDLSCKVCPYSHTLLPTEMRVPALPHAQPVPWSPRFTSLSLCLLLSSFAAFQLVQEVVGLFTFIWLGFALIFCCR